MKAGACVSQRILSSIKAADHCHESKPEIEWAHLFFFEMNDLYFQICYIERWVMARILECYDALLVHFELQKSHFDTPSKALHHSYNILSIILYFNFIKNRVLVQLESYWGTLTTFLA